MFSKLTEFFLFSLRTRNFFMNFPKYVKGNLITEGAVIVVRRTS